MSKEEIAVKEKKLLEMVSLFSKKKLDEEYEELSIKLIKKLGRKHNVPFKRGKLEIWASAVIYALGQINFLFDKSFDPYLTPDDICDYFNTKKSTVSDKARQIREILNIGHFDEEFSIKRMEDDGMVQLDNGLIIPKSMIDSENSVTLMTLMAERLGTDEENLKESYLNDFIENNNDNESEIFLAMLSNPISRDEGNKFLDDIFNENFDENISLFSNLDNDDIELFEDYVIDENNPLETIEDYERAIELFRTTKGEEYFKENEGYFWGMLETRPFIIDLLNQSILLWEDNQKERAIDQLKYILKLNPDDNTGVRYILINNLLELNRLKEAEDLIDYFDEEYSSIWYFSKLLLSIKNKDDDETIKKLYNEANNLNKYIVPFLIGTKETPNHPAEFYSLGDENEAINYFYLAIESWMEDTEAIDILKDLRNNGS
ncbi:DUF6398 domain-containing protein [Methanobrevibacter sp. DSM 116169]|uniref:DUF6398 domain-containing protein n=1 Tax=Methanobrevibacter sp. DSM 116169 TaxID=3242727 RepID=UPI0038FCA656